MGSPQRAALGAKRRDPVTSTGAQRTSAPVRAATPQAASGSDERDGGAEGSSGTASSTASRGAGCAGCEPEVRGGRSARATTVSTRKQTSTEQATHPAARSTTASTRHLPARGDGASLITGHYPSPPLAHGDAPRTARGQTTSLWRGWHRTY